MEYELYHHGIKGQRWGIRRFQRKDGTLTPAGLKRYNKELEKLEKEKQILANKRATQSKLNKLKSLRKDIEDEKNALDGKKADTKDPDYEAQKQQAIKSGSASELLKYKGDLTRTEMESAVARIRWEQELKRVSEQDVKAGSNAADKVFDSVGKVNDYAKKTIQLYNTAANVYNAFSKSSISLPRISTNVDNDNRALRNKEKERAKEKADDQKAKAKEAAAAAKKEADKRAYESYQRQMESDAAARERAYGGSYRVHGSNRVDPILRTRSSNSTTESSTPKGVSGLLSGSTKQNSDTGKRYVSGLLGSSGHESTQQNVKRGRDYTKDIITLAPDDYKVL